MWLGSQKLNRRANRYTLYSVLKTIIVLKLVILMRDKRTVDELSIEELERVLAIKRRSARQEQMERMQRTGRVVPKEPPPPVSTTNSSAAPVVQPLSTSSIPQFEDGFTPAVTKRKNDSGQVARRAMDRVLLLIEGSAVIGLVALGVLMLQSIGTLQDETARAQSDAAAQIRASIPTFVPTPVLQLADIVLPGGHTPPTTADGGQFNFEEIPVALRGQVRDQMLLLPEMVRPPITEETAQSIRLPDIGIDAVIVQGVDPEALKLGVGQLTNGVTPNSGGNLVLAAHNDIYGELFRHIVDLKPGMYFEVYTEKKVYTYVVTGHEIVKPDDVHVMGNRGGATATLITCYPYQVNTERYVVYAERVDT
jgi:sortase A